MKYAPSSGFTAHGWFSPSALWIVTSRGGAGAGGVDGETGAVGETGGVGAAGARSAANWAIADPEITPARPSPNTILRRMTHLRACVAVRIGLLGAGRHTRRCRRVPEEKHRNC